MMLEQIGDLKNRKSVEKNSTLSVGYAYKLEQDSIRNAVLPVSIKMYPNPTDEYVILEMSRTYNRALSVRIYNALGELLSISTIPMEAKLVKVNTTFLKTGVYKLIVSDTENTIFNHSLIVTK